MIQFDPYAPEMDADPFPVYRRLRDEHPCLYSEQAGMWVLTRHADILAALQDWQTFSSSQGNLIDELPNRAGQTLGTTDPPRHDRLRALVMVAFTKRMVERLEEPARVLARTLAQQARERGRFDFVGDFSSQITVTILFELMGLPAEDHREVRNKVILSTQTDKETRQKAPEHVAAFQWLRDYVGVQVAERRKNPRDDLLGRLVAAEIDGEHLDHGEIINTAATLILAGVESLSSFMTMLALNLATFADGRRAVAAAPDLIRPAIEESLRYNTSAQRFRRVLMRDVALHGQTMRTGDRVALCYGSGNRDRRAFADPDRYDVERRPVGHLGFGGGKHLCLGTAVARLITAVAMTEFLAAIPDYQAASESLDWTPSTTFRAPVALPLVVDNSALNNVRA